MTPPNEAQILAFNPPGSDDNSSKVFREHVRMVEIVTLSLSAHIIKQILYLVLPASVSCIMLPHAGL